MSRRVIEFTVFCVLVFCASGQSARKETQVLGINAADGSQDYVPNEIIVKFRDVFAGNIEKQLANGETPKGDWPGSLQRLNERYKLAKVRQLAPGFAKSRQFVKELEKKDKLQLNAKEKHILQRARRAPRGALVPNLGNIYKMRFSIDANDSLQEILEAYRNDPDVEYAELNHIVRGLLTPDDPYYAVQWALDNTGQPYPVSGGATDSGTPDADIDAPDAWNIYTGGSDIIVAVIDSGVDYTHKDLVGNMWTDTNGKYGYDYVNDDDDPMDDFGHGTHCAGIIAAMTNNSLDTAGVCWNARIMAVKSISSDNTGTESGAVSAIYYAVDNGADVLSNSWGGPYSESIGQAVNYAYSQGVIIVAAAGNDNSSSPLYPAYYEHVISVAATDSDDNKASFSSYGEWVDIAAPGVDILSLRAKNTDMYLRAPGYNPGDRFVPFGNPGATTYIASGTSMACPYVSGACALMLSANPALTSDEANAILVNTVDPIADGICYSDGRLNLSGSLTQAILSQSKGYITFDRNDYNCDIEAGIFLSDGDISGTGTHAVSITTSGGDSETVVLTEKNPPVGAFTGTIRTTIGEPNIEDGNLQVANDDVIYATYYDADDGTGNPATATDTGTIDCIPPVISNVQMNITASKLIVTFDTDEPTIGKISCGPACGGPYILEGLMYAQTSHTIEVSPLLPFTTHYFIVTATDGAGNQTVDSNSGNCFSFTTTGPGNIYVPSQYSTIQEAINQSWPGSVVWIADGTYMGTWNRDIDLLGKALTVKSENGPENCIIDCQGDVNDPHRGFSFKHYEGADSVVDGLTITNGYGPFDYRDLMDLRSAGGGIYCYYSSPTIKNCKITGNKTSYDRGHGDGPGGGVCFDYSNATIRNCEIIGNFSGDAKGAGVFGRNANVLIADCVISGNDGSSGGGAAFEGGAPVINGCIIIDNLIYCGRGVLYFEQQASPNITNCLITGNRSTQCSSFGGICAWLTGGHAKISNCTIIENTISPRGGAIYWDGIGATVTNCICRGNGNEIYGDVAVGYSNIQGGQPGTGNIDADPCFVSGPMGDYYLSQAGSGQPMDSPCVDTGSDKSANLGMKTLTTRTDGITDTGMVDMGYHYPGADADLNGDGFVDFVDYASMALNWQQATDPCEPNSGDVSKDGWVDIDDFYWLALQWLTISATAADNLQPPNNATIAISPVVLRWSPGEKYISHDVYFGKDYNEVEGGDIYNPNVYMGNQDSNAWDTNEYDANGLEYETAYYWRIDENYGRGIIKGDVWRFTTFTADSDINLVGWWRFDEGTGNIANDSSGNNFHGAIIGATWIDDPNRGWCLGFDGNDDYVDCGNGPSNNDDITVSAWMRTATEGILVSNRYNVDSYGTWYTLSSMDIEVGDNSQGGYRHLNFIMPTLDGNWHHIVYTKNGTSHAIYIDGSPDQVFTSDADISWDVPTYIGKRWTKSTYASWFNGTIDNVRIYNKSLSPEEILQLYQSGL
ncbi:MAG: S8 family serine peptidase [Sedimentisphaerales bacterium]|nr:S8 family serine peptidase [Sedimentisphaerales bacterium]